MTIKQALKKKNKLVQKLTDVSKKITTYNSYDNDSVRPYDVRQLVEEETNLLNELVDLKTKIHTANLPVYSKIFRLSELKSQVSKLKSLDCTEGKSRDRWGRITEDNPTLKTVIINVVERDNMVEAMENEIESIQDHLDMFNATTII